MLFRRQICFLNQYSVSGLLTDYLLNLSRISTGISTISIQSCCCLTLTVQIFSLHIGAKGFWVSTQFWLLTLDNQLFNYSIPRWSNSRDDSLCSCILAIRRSQASYSSILLDVAIKNENQENQEIKCIMSCGNTDKHCGYISEVKKQSQSHCEPRDNQFFRQSPIDDTSLSK